MDWRTVLLWVLAGIVVLMIGLCLGALHLTGKHILAVEAQRDLYRRLALLAIEDARKVQEVLDELVAAVLEAANEKPKVAKVDRSWD